MGVEVGAGSLDKRELNMSFEGWMDSGKVGLLENRKVEKVILTRENNVNKIKKWENKDAVWEHEIIEFYQWGGFSYGNSLHDLCPQDALEEGHMRNLHQLPPSCPAFFWDPCWSSSYILSLENP